MRQRLPARCCSFPAVALSEVRSNPNNSPLICDASCSGSRSALTISLAMSETMWQSAGRRAPCAVPSHAHDLYTLLPSEFRAYLGGIHDGQAALVNAISIQPCRVSRCAHGTTTWRASSCMPSRSCLRRSWTYRAMTSCSGFHRKCTLSACDVEASRVGNGGSGGDFGAGASPGATLLPARGFSD